MSSSNGRKTSSRLAAPDRRRQIIGEASALFANQGFDAVTVKEIAATCHINQAVLYRHFPSKEHLYLAVLEEKIHRLETAAFLKGLDRKQPIGELLKTVALYVLSIGDRDPEVNRLLLYGMLQGSREAQALFRAWRQPFVDFLEKEIARRARSGEIRRIDAHITARSFIGMVMDCSVSCFLWPQFGYDHFDPNRAVDNNVEIFLHGLLP